MMTLRCDGTAAAAAGAGSLPPSLLRYKHYSTAQHSTALLRQRGGARNTSALKIMFLVLPKIQAAGSQKESTPGQWRSCRLAIRYLTPALFSRTTLFVHMRAHP
jgi:hypothetical protein